MDKVELAACPFCGGPGAIGSFVLYRKRWYYPTCAGEISVICPGIVMEQDEQGGTHCDFATEAEAITAWNARTEPSAASLQARISVLEGALALWVKYDNFSDEQFSSVRPMIAYNEAIEATRTALKEPAR